MHCAEMSVPVYQAIRNNVTGIEALLHDNQGPIMVHINKIRDACAEGEKDHKALVSRVSDAARTQRLLSGERQKHGILTKRVRVSSLFHLVTFHLVCYMTYSCIL